MSAVRTPAQAVLTAAPGGSGGGARAAGVVARDCQRCLWAGPASREGSGRAGLGGAGRLEVSLSSMNARAPLVAPPAAPPMTSAAAVGAVGALPAAAPLPLRAVGFCGPDDSVACCELLALSAAEPWLEWGVLFRPEKEGQPRFPSRAWVAELCRLRAEAVRGARARGGGPLLAAHLCSSRCDEVLDGDAGFVLQLAGWGFSRVQVNATKANGVRTERLSQQADSLARCILATPALEWIIQRNAETRVLWEPLLARAARGELPNLSVLFDDSVGTGVERTSFPAPIPGVPCGYAGGIGPANVRKILEGVRGAYALAPEPTRHCAPWCDMESSLRHKTPEGDLFSLDKVRAVVAAVKAAHADGHLAL